LLSSAYISLLHYLIEYAEDANCFKLNDQMWEGEASDTPVATDCGLAVCVECTEYESTSLEKDSTGMIYINAPDINTIAPYEFYINVFDQVYDEAT
jgi:DNA polymerase IIIc chi subunit